MASRKERKYHRTRNDHFCDPGTYLAVVVERNHILAMNTSILYSLAILIISASCSVQAQVSEKPVRIEFNSGTRMYREQFIFTPDSVITVKEDFRKNDHANHTRRKTSPSEWRALVESLKEVSLPAVSTLESPTMKRASDAAAIGTIIITTGDGKSYTHEFDDENPHQTFKPLMKQIKKISR